MKRGCNPFGCNFQFLSCLGCLGFLLVFCFISFLLSNPPQINSELNNLLYTEKEIYKKIIPPSLDLVEKELIEQIDQVGINEVKINNEALQRFLIDKFGFNISSVNIYQSGIEIKIIIDESNNGILDLTLNLTLSEDKKYLELSKLFLGKIEIPKPITNFILENLVNNFQNNNLFTDGKLSIDLIIPKLNGVSVLKYELIEDNFLIKIDYKPELL